jgi:hypothetical protein
MVTALHLRAENKEDLTYTQRYIYTQRETYHPRACKRCSGHALAGDAGAAGQGRKRGWGCLTYVCVCMCECVNMYVFLRYFWYHLCPRTYL